MTTTIYRDIPLGTVKLATMLRDIANRPRLNRRLARRADRIQQELEWRAAQAMSGLSS